MDTLEIMKESIREALPGLDMVLGWERGYDALHATPLVIKTAEDVDRLILGPTCVQGLAVHLPQLKGKKVGIVVKGCDSKAVVQLLRENLLDRKDIVIFGFGCDGVVSLKRLAKTLDGLDSVRSVEKKGDRLAIETEGGVHDLAFDDVCATKCLDCAHRRLPRAIQPWRPSRKSPWRNGSTSGSGKCSACLSPAPCASVGIIAWPCRATRNLFPRSPTLRKT